MRQMSTTLGPFQLRDLIGAGGMGTVFRVVHQATGQQVALKVLTSDRARQSNFRRQFRQEVQALAKLHHPSIASIADFGIVAEQDVDGRISALTPGAPWIAMEYVEGAPLTEFTADWSWERFRSALVALFDALAHAHARGIVHRDIKPSNVLARDTDDGVEVKLVDFGIAQLFDSEESAPTDSEFVRGTPKYMAPEQILDRWRDQGPWTDLYALGCMVWEIVCDSPPFDAEEMFDVLDKHLQGERAAFQPRRAVPANLVDWLDQMMTRRPERRVQRAADAARALIRLGSPPEGERGPTVRASSTDGMQEEPVGTLDSDEISEAAEADTISVETVESDITDTVPVWDEEPEGPKESAPRRGRTTMGTSIVMPPPVPKDWRRPVEKEGMSPIPGAGLELFDMREVPFVDRGAERDWIWESLRRVADGGALECIMVSGPAGSGKSRLVEWMATRAHEAGAARILRAVHSAGGEGRAGGLAAMVQRATHAWGLSRVELYEHLIEKLPSLGPGDDLRLADARALTELIIPGEGDRTEGPAYRFSSRRQIHALILRFIRRLGRDRPIFLWLDDLQWGPDALGFLEFLASEVDDPPQMLVVATVRSDVLAERPGLAERFESVGEEPNAASMSLGPLEASDHRDFIEQMLPLAEPLAQRLADRTEGNPLFAVQLVGEWLDAGHVALGEDGRLHGVGAEPGIPDDIHSLWMERVDRLAADVGAAGGAEVIEALELAAAFGREVNDEEWRRAVDAYGIEVGDHIVDELVERGLARRTDYGWAFTHGLLVESLGRRAETEGRWREHHRRCARTLDRLYADQFARTAARRADHLVEAGEIEAALEPLLVEAERLGKMGDYEALREVWERRAKLLDRLGVPSKDPDRLANEIGEARWELLTGEWESAAPRAERALGVARAQDCHLLAAKALRILGACHRRRGELSEARRCMEEAAGAAAEAGDPGQEGKALSQLGRLERDLGNLDASERHLEQARATFSSGQDRYWELWSHYHLAWLAMVRGRDNRAREQFERVLDEAREAGFRRLEASCESGLGELARFGGQLEKARSCYERYTSIAAELGQPESEAVSLLNLAQVELASGDFRATLDHLETAERRLERNSVEEHTHAVALTRLGWAAGTEDWSAFDEVFGSYRDGWPEESRLDKDHPWLLEIAGDYAQEAGRRQRARRVWRLARDLSNRLGNDDAVARLDARLSDAE